MANKEQKEALAIERFKPFILPILALTLIDQIVKVVISISFMQYDFDIVPHLLRFNPKLNVNLSYVGNFIDAFSNLYFMIFLNILVIFVLLSGYMLYKAKGKQNALASNLIMTCGMAGSICSLIDKLFWGGSLDFLQIPGMFIFDLKDCYLTVAVVVFVIVSILHGKEISVKEYVRFCFNKFKLK